MRAKQGDVVKPVVVNRPVWKDPSSYIDVANWSYRRWAWEFLRRNSEFAEETKKGRVRLPKEKDRIAHKFGRVKYKAYNEEYSKLDDEGRYWLPECIVSKSAWHEDLGENLLTGLSIGQVALVFDLTQTLKGGETAISSLLAHARELLHIELENYENSFPKGKGPRVRRIPRSSLFRLLRLHDAVNHFKAEEETIIIELYGSSFRKRDSPSVAEMVGAKKKMKVELRRAKTMVGADYLSLVPLDSIQERKSTKLSKSNIGKESASVKSSLRPSKNAV